MLGQFSSAFSARPCAASCSPKLLLSASVPPAVPGLNSHAFPSALANLLLKPALVGDVAVATTTPGQPQGRAPDTTTPCV